MRAHMQAVLGLATVTTARALNGAGAHQLRPAERRGGSDDESAFAGAFVDLLTFLICCAVPFSVAACCCRSRARRRQYLELTSAYGSPSAIASTMVSGGLGERLLIADAGRAGVGGSAHAAAHAHHTLPATARGQPPRFTVDAQPEPEPQPRPQSRPQSRPQPIASTNSFLSVPLYICAIEPDLILKFLSSSTTSSNFRLKSFSNIFFV